MCAQRRPEPASQCKGVSSRENIQPNCQLDLQICSCTYHDVVRQACCAHPLSHRVHVLLALHLHRDFLLAVFLPCINVVLVLLLCLLVCPKHGVATLVAPVAVTWVS